MNDFIEQVVRRVGISEPAARAMTGGLLGLIRRQASAADFLALTRAMPGAAQMVRRPPVAGTGRLSRLAHDVIHALAGEKPAVAFELAALFREAGVAPRQGEAFLDLFVECVRARAGAELVDRLLGRVTWLRPLVG